MEASAGGVAFYDTSSGAGGELEASTELQRNQPVPRRRAGAVQATLAMRINGTTPCDNHCASGQLPCWCGNRC
jgi:hypothetical protein